VNNTRLYLDNCCFNCPYDNQNNMNIYLETEAKLYIQNQIKNGLLELAWSYVLEYENDNNPHIEKRKLVSDWKDRAIIDIDAAPELVQKAAVLEARGLDQYDALHIACAVAAKCDYFITTDKDILKKNSDCEGVRIVNPIEYVRLEVKNENRHGN
jgi:predicted nucleic acid-binding protein